MNNFMISFIITFIAGISTLLGGFIPFLKINNKDKIILTSLGFASGIMISISILDLLPSSFSYLFTNYNLIKGLFLIVLSFFLGIITFSLLDKLLSKDVDNLYRVGIFSMIAIILHNVPEGIITFILSTSDVRLGLFLGISIALHNIPEGISVMVPVYYGSNNFKKAFLYTLIAGIAEPIGGVVFYLLFKNYISNCMLGFLFSFIAGVMIYLSIKELLPKSLEYKNGRLTLFSFMIGIIFFLIVHLFMH